MWVNIEYLVVYCPLFAVLCVQIGKLASLVTLKRLLRNLTKICPKADIFSCMYSNTGHRRRKPVLRCEIAGGSYFC